MGIPPWGISGFQGTWDHQIGRFELMYQSFYPIITFRVSRIDDAKCIVVTAVCVLSVWLCVCPSLHARTTTWMYNFGEWYGVPPSCALLGGFAIGTAVSLL